jgi:tetratricopeptide (TPR) repeat protein
MACGLMAGALLASVPAAALAQARPVDDVVVSPQASGRWLRAESDHVIVYSDEPAEVLRRQVSDLEALDLTLRTLYGKLDGPPPRKFPIYLVRPAGPGDVENAAYRRFIPGAPATSLFTDVAEPDDIFAVVVRNNFRYFDVVDRTEGDDGVLGAYALHFFSENFPFRQPRWLIKGAAIYYSSIDIRPDSVVVGKPPALFDNEQLAKKMGQIARVIAERGDDWTSQEKQRRDAQSALLVRYLWSDPDRKARLATYLDRIEGGDRDLNATWGEVFGQPVDTLEASLASFLRDEPVLTTIPRPTAPPPVIKIHRMPAGANDLILELQQLKAGFTANRPALLARFRKAAARRPDERYSRQALARAEITIGDRNKGERLLEQLLREDPGNLEALRLMGSSKLYRAAADPAQRVSMQASARPYLARADAIEPNDYQTLFLLAQTMANGDTPSPERLALLRRAVTLAPEVAKIRLTAAVAFLLANDTQNAFLLLKPISADPYGGPEAAKAKELLDLMASVAAPAARPPVP